MVLGVLLSLLVALLSVLRFSLVRGRRALDVNPRYRPLLDELRLREVDDFLRLQAVIVCGHRHRHTAHVTLSAGPLTVRAFLKREQTTYWRDYVSSVWAGLGWGSRSCREGRMLQALRAAQFPCPEFIAAGEDDRGRAFLLVRELEGTHELRQVLREPGGDRRRLARRLGRTLAYLHDAGFWHADLYSKHVHVHPADETIHFLDWQRAQCRRWLGWQRRLNDLASLDATLTDDLASPRERLDCLRAYLRACRSRLGSAAALAYVRAQAGRLLRKRHVREARQAPLATGVQNLVWLDGEALCVTREFLDAVGGRVPEWLLPAHWPGGPQNQRSVQPAPVAGSPAAVLARSWTSRPWRWLGCKVRGRPLYAPEMRQAACLFRLQRYGVATPRLLAVGQRFRRPWRSESFLLTEPVPCHAGLAERLVELSWQAGPYRRLLREAGTVLRRLHESGCYLPVRSAGDLDAPFGVGPRDDGTPQVVVRSVAELRLHRRPRRSRAWVDLMALDLRFSAGLISRTDALRFLLGYLEVNQRDAAGRRQLRDWFGRRP